jgi:DNA-binding beta-propeller fold protein YncE
MLTMVSARHIRNIVRVELARLLGLIMAVQAAFLTAKAGEATFSLELVFGSPGSGPGEFRYPEDFALSPDGRLFVTDATHAFVQIFDPQTGRFLARFGGRADSPSGLVKPEGIAIAPDGDIYVADYDTGFIKRFGADLAWKQTFSEFGSGPGQNIRSEFMSIYDGRLYMADAGNHRVDVFDLSGRFLFDFGGHGTGDGQFNNPEAAKVNSIGEVFVADLKNNRVQVFDKAGKFSRSWGRSGKAKGEFDAPAGIGFDAHDNVYVSEIGNNRVQVFRPDGSSLAVFGEAGKDPGQLHKAHGVVVDPKTGRVFVADTGNHRIQVFTPDNPTALEPQLKID